MFWGPLFVSSEEVKHYETKRGLPCDPALDWVAVFEAPIDLMSFCTLHREVTSNAVALCGLYQGPLDTCLRENPRLKHIVLCLDADGPGREATEKFREEYAQKGYTVSTRTPAHGKDWNDQLQYERTGKIPESSKQHNKPKKEADKPMANIEKMISDKAADDARWREQRKKEHEHAAELRDVGIADITTDPAVYAQYLNLQGDNPEYSAGNIAMVMTQAPEATVFRTIDRWKALGRVVVDRDPEHEVKEG